MIDFIYGVITGVAGMLMVMNFISLSKKDSR
jgi:hypothetical protein